MVQARDGLGTAAAVADVALAFVFVLILAGLALLFFQLRRIHGTVRELAGRLESRLDPLIDRGKEVAANVEFITGAIRMDVQRVSSSVKSLSDRLQAASDRMEERVEEFNALMEVVQGEAEDIFIGSAAAVRGVRAGARALREGGSGDGAALAEEPGVGEPTPAEVAALEAAAIEGAVTAAAARAAALDAERAARRSGPG